MFGMRHSHNFVGIFQFCTNSVAAYIQVQYRVTEVHPTGLNETSMRPLATVRPVGCTPVTLYWARIFSHFMFMEKTSGLTKTCASLWSPLVSLGFLSVILPLCFSQLIISWDVFPKHYFYKIIIIINWKVKIFMWLEFTSPPHTKPYLCVKRSTSTHPYPPPPPDPTQNLDFAHIYTALVCSG